MACTFSGCEEMPRVRPRRLVHAEKAGKTFQSGIQRYKIGAVDIWRWKAVLVKAS